MHWLDKYSNHIELLSGVTSEGIQAKWASKKISEYLESAAFLSKTHRPRGILLYRGDAMGPRSSWEQLALPSAAAIDHDYDLVISLDSCYHYNTRRHFFRQVYQQLRPGGILSMTDLILAEGLTRDQELKMGITAGFGVPSSSLKSHVNLLIQNIILYLIAMATSIPFLNLQTLENYVVDLGKSGFSNIEVFDISPHVFIGLSNSIDRQTRKYQQAKSPSPSGWGKYRFVVGPFMRWLDSTRLLRFVVVRAEKRIVK